MYQTMVQLALHRPCTWGWRCCTEEVSEVKRMTASPVRKLAVLLAVKLCTIRDSALLCTWR